MKQHTIIFIGPQGSGKGTQIANLDAYLRSVDPDRRVVDIQSGRQFRTFAAEERGYAAEHVASTLDSGILQPLFLTVSLWGNEFLRHVDADCHLLIDGFPRVVEEAVVLESALSFYKRDTIHIVFLDTPEEVVRGRMIARSRSDDTRDSIEERLSWYREKTLPVVEYYRTRSGAELITIDGTQSIDAVAAAVLAGLKISE